MTTKSKYGPTSYPVVSVKQWLSGWEKIPFDKKNRLEPPHQFYLFSISALALKRLTGVTRRERKGARLPQQETAVQRKHLPERSREILKFLKFGFPLSKQNERKIREERATLQMPGWLPTSILVNINSEAVKLGNKASAASLIVEENSKGEICTIHLPTNLEKDGWHPSPLPMDIIDGQHRLWALDEEMRERYGETLPKDIQNYEVPVVAFVDLAPSWQAYLFYTINQLPKRIDTSLAFDLYPLLRTQDWLLRFEGPAIYRETRAQDLVTTLWSYSESPWKGRILRFGGREKGKVTQAAFVRTLFHSFIRTYEGKGRSRIGGLFGHRRNENEPVLNWDRDQQAAFLIIIWNYLFEAVKGTKEQWAVDLRTTGRKASADDILAELGFMNETPSDDVPRKDVIEEIAFAGPETLIAADQGVRGICVVFNDLVWAAHESNQLDLENWQNSGASAYGEESISEAIKKFPKQCKKTDQFIQDLARSASRFDWRRPSAMSNEDPQYDRQSAYLGSGGYKRIRINLLEHIQSHCSKSTQSLIADWSAELKLVNESDDDE